MKIDGILLEVIGNTFMSIAEEMGAVLVKSAYSTNIKERKDCSCALFDAAGNTIAQAEHIPMHLGSMLGLIGEIKRHFKLEEIKPGDMFIANDPYNGGGTHLPDIAVASPVFYDGEIVAFVANIAHHNDVGGRVPGSNAADSDSIYAEGIRIPTVKIFREGELDKDILNLILLNCRVRHIRLGDLNAQFACNKKGVQRMEDVCAKYGKETVALCMEELLDYSERKIRMALSAIPNGSHEFEDYLDSDGLGSGPIKLNVKVAIKDEDIELDFTDNPDQVKGAINLPLSALRASVYYAIRSIVDPSLPSNGGYYRAIHIKSRPGCILGCTEPAACAGRSDTAQRVADMIFGAMSEVVPHQVIAGSNSSITGVYFGGVSPDTGEYYVYMETFGGGSGARFNKDGLSCVQVHMSNTSNLPIESMEVEFPYMVERYELVTDSGGPGKYRGGLSMSKDIRVLGHDSEFTIKADRQKVPPYGLFGGKPGLPGLITIYPDTDEARTVDSKKSGNLLKANGVLRCQMPGAGGYGNPLERSRELLIKDLEEGYVSPESAMRDYGMTQEELDSVNIFRG
ncbi:hydantoinase B/oxoprolinase family protein [uncultured Cloacibacillus sp.]|uniref:hydantoinase B/oxoprolinase family protein n=1 Tax=uncultured Cloacibacillus sp. TaxID=889794 RepID=UPI001F86EB33|nr:hydantoinase B/oxoprolinase family protein [uncultured Cloacibacillus sp.]HIR17659.1 hydantoinase B/oxoprolinase family protein [Candidatus Caccocola faecigallinarum]